MIAQNVTLLNEYQALIDRIFTSIAANAEGKPTDRPPVEIMKDIVELDKKMQQGLDQIEEHQRVHKKILQVIKEIEAENNTFMEFVNELKNGKEQLEICLDEANETIQAINFSSESSVTADEILKYANRISSYTSAPPNYISGTFAEPPYPDESRMRRSFLFRQDADMMFNEGDKNDDEDEEEEDGDDMHYINPNSYGSLETMQQQETFDLDLNPDLE